MKEAYIFLGPECNLKCRFCYSSPKMPRLSKQEAETHIQNYISNGFDSIAFTGGEPTVRPELAELISCARDAGAKHIKIQTNGLLTSDIIYLRQLKESGLNAMYVSMQSHNSDTHDKLVNMQESHEKAVMTLANCRELDLPVEIGLVITRKNSNELLEFLKFASLFKPDKIQFLLECPSEGALNNKDIIPRLADIELHLHMALDYALNNRIRVLTRGVPLCYLPDHETMSVEYLTLSSGNEGMIESLGGNSKAKHSFHDTNAKCKVCEICRVNEVCGGVWMPYILLFGCNEIYPLFHNINNE